MKLTICAAKTKAPRTPISGTLWSSSVFLTLPAQYASVEKSFSVQSKMSRAMQLMGAYKVDGVPMVIVNGKYVTSTGHAGSPERVVPVMEQLIAMARKDMGTTAAAPAAAKPAAAK